MPNTNRKNGLLPFLFALLVSAGCRGTGKEPSPSPAGTKPGGDTLAAHNAPAGEMTFFDSVMAKKELTWQQVVAHTGIEEYYYTGIYNNATMEGDTVIHFNQGVTGAVLDYSDGRVCSRKLLFLFPPGATAPSGNAEIETSCDRDLSSDYFYKTYELLSDSTVQVKTWYVAPESGETGDQEDSASLWEVRKLRVNRKGKADTISTRLFHD